MKHIISIAVAGLLLVGLLLASAAPVYAASLTPVRASEGLADAELPPDLFDEDCDGGPSCPGRIFVDLPAAGHWAHVPIDWALTHHVTAGTSPNTFSPGAGCTRAQAVTFLWRASGAPAPATADCPFEDVPETAYYYRAVLWAVERQITSGTSDTTFSPTQVCTRAQIITFLWRAKGSPAASAGEFPFQDVAESAYYRNAVAWAIEKGITGGTAPTAFSPHKTCTRAQIVTFLYKTIHG